MSGTRRLQKEFKDLQSSGIIETESVKNLEIDSQSILQWSGKLNPTKVLNHPYLRFSSKNLTLESLECKKNVQSWLKCCTLTCEHTLNF